MTIAEVAFILLGIGLAFRTVGPAGPGDRTLRAASVSAGLLLVATAIFVTLQHRGLFTGLLSALRRCRIRIEFLESREDKLRALDHTILMFYRQDRRRFLLSTGVFFVGWLAEALEVYAILYYLGGPVEPLSALSSGAASVFLKGGTFLIPGSVGAQAGGSLLSLLAFAAPHLICITSAP